MRNVPITQFLRPDGKMRLGTVEVSDNAGDAFTQAASLGLRLTAEVIPGDGEIEDQVCVCLEHPDWGDYRLALAPNIPDGPILKEIDSMLLAFDAADYHAWLADLQDDD